MNEPSSQTGERGLTGYRSLSHVHLSYEETP